MVTCSNVVEHPFAIDSFIIALQSTPTMNIARSLMINLTPAASSSMTHSSCNQRGYRSHGVMLMTSLANENIATEMFCQKCSSLMRMCFCAFSLRLSPYVCMMIISTESGGMTPFGGSRVVFWVGVSSLRTS